MRLIGLKFELSAFTIAKFNKSLNSMPREIDLKILFKDFLAVAILRVTDDSDK